MRECLNLTADLGMSEIRGVHYETPLRADAEVRGELAINAIAEAPNQPDRGLIDADIKLFDDTDSLVLRQNVVFAVARQPRRDATIAALFSGMNGTPRPAWGLCVGIAKTPALTSVRQYRQHSLSTKTVHRRTAR